MLTSKEIPKTKTNVVFTKSDFKILNLHMLWEIIRDSYCISSDVYQGEKCPTKAPNPHFLLARKTLEEVLKQAMFILMFCHPLYFQLVMPMEQELGEVVEMTLKGKRTYSRIREEA